MNAALFLKTIDRLLGTVLVKHLPPPVAGVTAERKAPSSFLIIRPGGIGDAVLLVPAIRALRNSFPNASVEVLAEGRNHAIFKLCSEVDRIFCYDRPRELLAVLRRRYDVVIDTEQWHRLSAMVCRLVRSSMKVGFDTNERRRMFTHPIPYSRDRYEAESFSQLLEPLGATEILPPVGEILTIPDAARLRVASMLRVAVQLPLLALFPSASVPEKRWELGKFRDLVGWCTSQNLNVVILGGERDRALSKQIAAGQEAIDLAGRTSLAETAAVLEQAAIVVSGDSGVLHLASCLGRPSVSLFGPSNADKWAPRGAKHIVVNHRIPCSPCSHFGSMPKCPNDARCLAEIGVQEVKDAVLTLLQRISEGKLL